MLDSEVQVVPVKVVVALGVIDDEDSKALVGFEESCSLEGGVSMAFFKVIGVTFELSSSVI